MHWLNDLLTQFYNAQWHVTDHQAIYYREIVGNVFGLASALLGMWRKVWTWPIGMLGNALLFTVFLGQALGNGQGTPSMARPRDRSSSSSSASTAGGAGARTADPASTRRPSYPAGPPAASARRTSRSRWVWCWSAR